MAARGRNRFRLGHVLGASGAFAAGASLGLPWLRLDLVAAASAVQSGQVVLPPGASRAVMQVARSTPVADVSTSPRVSALAADLGVAASGFAQERFLAVTVIAAALLGLAAVLRSVMAATPWNARRPSGLLVVAALAGFAAAAAELFVLAPEPRSAMVPATGFWILLAGCGLMLISAALIGSMRTVSWSEEHDDAPAARRFEGADSMAYSHGAWVPRGVERQPRR